MIAFLFILLLQIAPVNQQIELGDQLLQQGLEAEANGDLEMAIDYWIEARLTLEEAHPEIGFEFIRLVTEYHLKDYFEYASNMYYWALSGSGVNSFKDVLDKETERMRPVVDNSTYLKWKQYIRSENPALFEEIRAFWIAADPTPGLPNNERLIEHWERVVHATKNFQNNSRTGLGLDDRALIHIRYGSPTRQRSGTLEFNPMRAEGLMEIRIAPTGQVSDCARSYIESLRRQAEMMHQSPRYEIWVYEWLPNMKRENVIFTFGTEPDAGAFKLVNAVDELIPRRAHSLSNRGEVYCMMQRVDYGVTPGILLQMMYYEQLATVDHFFGVNAVNLEREFTRRMNPPGSEQAMLARSQNVMELQERVITAPREESGYSRLMADIPVDVYQYRFQDQNGNPYLTTFVESRPQDAFWQDFALFSDEDRDAMDEVFISAETLNYYKLHHTFQLFSPAMQQMRRLNHEPAMVLDEASEEISGSVFIVPYVDASYIQIVSARLENHNPATRPLFPTPFPDELRGVGKIQIQQPEPLKIAGLELSDIVLGYQLNQEAEGVLFPFVVANNRKIPLNESLVLHFEVYDLTPDQNGISSFQVDYSIAPVNILGWTQQRSEQFSLSLNFEHDSSFFKENLEIFTADLGAGRYNLQFTVTDLRTGVEVSRQIRFEIVD
jgi:GWxTD domain-containing protein